MQILGLHNGSLTLYAWKRFRHIHGQPNGTLWPKMVYNQELRNERLALQATSKQQWRAIWHGRGIEPSYEQNHASF
jgi:hypothetical protein